VTDLSASRAVIEIAGEEARSLLEKGCGVDLHPRAFGPGQCAQTVFAKLPVIIDQLSPAPAYRLFVRRSAARWLADWLIDAAQEFRRPQSDS
jgi:sarcosine oxidase subunit gamma